MVLAAPHGRMVFKLAVGACAFFFLLHTSYFQKCNAIDPATILTISSLVVTGLTQSGLLKEDSAFNINLSFQIAVETDPVVLQGIQEIISQLYVVQEKLNQIHGAVKGLADHIDMTFLIQDYNQKTALLALLLSKANDYKEHPENYTRNILDNFCTSPTTDPMGFLDWLNTKIVTDNPDILATLIDKTKESEVDNLKMTFRSHLTQVALLKAICLSIGSASPQFIRSAIAKMFIKIKAINAKIETYQPIELACATYFTPVQDQDRRYVEYLDRHPIECPSGTVLNFLRFHNVDDYRKAKYEYHCCSSRVRIPRSCVAKESGWNAGGTIQHLDRHIVSCSDIPNSALSKFTLHTIDGRIGYRYSCCPTKPGKARSCQRRDTNWDDFHTEDLIYLDRQYIQCPMDLPYLNFVKLEWNGKNKNSARAKYQVECCSSE